MISASLASAAGERLASTPLLVMLDVDGTLAPIAPTPSAARVPEETRSVLRRLVAQPGTTVALVSGRAAMDAWRLAGVSGVWVIGNHGFELRDPSGGITPDPQVGAHEDAIADAARRLEQHLADVPGALVENKRWTLSVHYRVVPSAHVERLVTIAREVAGELGLRVFPGRKIVEIRPPVDVDKGTACVAFAARMGAEHHVSLLYAGDDRTDEDAFRALRRVFPRAVTVRILSAGESDGDSEAEFVLPDPQALRDFLDDLAARRRRLAASGDG